MTDEDEPESQWTAPAKEAYAARAEELIAALRDHAQLTLERTGRQAEGAQYVPSVQRLLRAAAAFDDAEFEWCGSFPLGIAADDDDDDDDESGDESAEAGVLTVVGRWDYEVVDAEALVAAGRAAYVNLWADDTHEDAVAAVSNAAEAAREIVHADGWGALERANGLEAIADRTVLILHDDDSADWLHDEGDPFAIARED